MILLLHLLRLRLRFRRNLKPLRVLKPLRFRRNCSERIWKMIMTIDDKNRFERLQYDINREAGEISTLSSDKIDKYEYLTGKEVL